MSLDDSLNLASLRRDCRHFRPERPCKPHKREGYLCPDCPEYDPAGFRVAIVKLAAVGDVLRSTSFLPGIRRRYRQARIDWLTLPSAAPLFENNPLVDGLHVTVGGALPALLAQVPFDLVLCPDADPMTVALAQGIPLAEGGRRVGFSLDGRGQVQPLSAEAERWFLMGLSDERKKANRETYQNLVGALLELETPVEDRPIWVVSDQERAEAEAWLASLGKRSAKKGARLVGINTGAGGRWPQKRWTLQGQTELIHRLSKEGHQVMLLGGPEEVERHRALRQACEGCGLIDAGNDNSLRAFAARLSLVDALVTGDTLALHLGTAFSKPVIALFGPTSHSEIELYGKGEKLFAEDLDCLCCYASCDKHPDCQESISVDRVHEALQPFLSERAPR
ncbi:MAG TPA: glycosyltransferase family 9 protein [Planctomycetes bacterium]|nr:glycosyltransferase family 9 protein [Planctomycetota bacterium]